MRVLTCLRIFGPISRDDMTKRVDLSWMAVHDETRHLEAQGLAVELPGDLWDITPKGRHHWGIAQTMRGLESACVGRDK